TVKEYPNPTLALACNDNVQISLDENCEALIGADMILEGGPYGCYDTRYTVMVLSPVGQNLGNTVNASFIGTTWTVKVVDNETGNSCWGSIIVEDKLKPTIECRDLTVDCNDLDEINEFPDPAPQITGPQTIIYEGLNEPIGEPGAPNPDIHSYDFDFSYIPVGTPVLDVDVRVKLTGHTWLPDLDIVVENPDGIQQDVFVVSGCFGAEFPIDCTFDDEGLGGVTQCVQLDQGGGPLQCFQAPGVQSNTILSAAFDGKNAGGVWKLIYRDNFLGDDGIIEIAGLIVTVDLPAIAPSDNCGPTTLDFVDSFTGGNCGGPSGTVVRTWTVTDASGNSASCNQTITFDRPNLDDVLIPGDILWTCDQYNAFPNITDPEHLHPYITDTDPGTEVIEVNLDPNCDDDDQVLGNGTKDWPEVNSTNVANGGNGCPGGVLSFVPAPNSGLDDADVLALTGSGVPTVDGKPLAYICGIEVQHTDLYIEDCPGTFKILRKWTVIDWCANPVDVREVNQVIKVADLVGPSINAPVDLTIDVYSASFPPGNPHAVCQGTFVVPAASGITDNCSGVVSYTTELWTLTGQLLQSVNGNGGVFTSVPMFINGLPASYTVRYYATDGCGNQGSDDTKITLKDKVPPVAVCDEITEVSITNNGLNTGQSCSTLYAADLDDGSYDNCKPVYFLIAKMDDSFSPNIFNRCYYPTRNFCCEDLGDQTVIVLVLDGNPAPFMTTLNSPSLGCDGTPGLFLSTGFSALNYNTCMVTVQVTDKLSPILVSCPQNTRVTCDWYADNIETGLTGLSSAEKCTYLTPYFGAATFWDNCSVNVTCNTNVNIDQCLEGTITRTWSAQDNAGNNGLQSCTQTIFVDNVSDWVVEFPADITVNCGVDVPDFGTPDIFYETCELVAVSYNDQVYTVVPDACYKIKRQWTVINWCAIGDDIDEETIEDPENALCLPFPACDLDKDGDCDDRTFRDSWSCGTYPGAANATTTLGPDTDLDSNPWDGYITYEQIIKVIDNVDPVFTNGCVIPDVCITDNTCGATVLLPTPEVAECSINVTITASGDLGSSFGPYTGVAPGTYHVTYNAKDNCNNQTDCHTTVTVKDCKKPVPYCKNGLVIELDPPADTVQVTVHAIDFNFASFDNCPGTLKFSFSSDVNDTQITYYCSDLGQQPVQMWVTDAAGNQDYCETFIIVQANLGQCNDDPIVAGVTATESNAGVQSVNVGINSSNGVFTQNTTTNMSGAYNFASVPAGGDYTVTPALDANPLNGVSTFDLVLISKHILGVQPLGSPYKMIAADANKSNSITTFDLVEIRKMILFINTEFPNNTSWRFVPKAYSFANPSNPFAATFPEVISLNNLTADQLAADFVAIKVGDVNGNAVTNLLGGNEDRTMTGDLVFNADDVNMEAGGQYTVEFKATDFNVSGYQFTMNFDKKALEFVEVANGMADASNFGLTMVDNGVITASWNSDEAKQLATGEVVFSLTFKANESGRMSEKLSINSRYTVAEAYNANGELMNVALSFNNTMVADGFALYQNTPNPFANSTTIGFYLPEATSATLTISDVQGKVVRVIEGNEFAKGYNQIDLKRSELGATGVLYYRLETATDSATRKMILVD
ncbi:MAG: T9SS type A sorting domain-containing protein, partial [Saprospiraceae bacterium]